MALNYVNGHSMKELPASDAAKQRIMDTAPASDPAQAQKKDEGKVPAWRGCIAYFSRALTNVAAISDFGFKKYGSWGGWVNVPDGRARYEDALMRHTLAMARGEIFDPESGMVHAAHRAWCALAVLELMAREFESPSK